MVRYPINCPLPKDYLDLFLIHDPYAGKEKRLESWKALIHKRDEGKLRTIGVSN